MKALLRKALVAVAARKIERSFKRPSPADRLVGRDGLSGSYGPRDLIPYRRQMWSGGYELKDPTPQDVFRWRGGEIYDRPSGAWVWKEAV